MITVLKKQQPGLAIQWSPNVSIPNIRFRPPTIRFSIDKQWYYAEAYDLRSQYWLSIDRTDGPTPQELKNQHWEGAYEWTNKAGGGKYYRRCRAFTFWDIKHHQDSVVLPPLDDLTQTGPNIDRWLDYVDISKWPDFPEPTAYLDILDGDKRTTIKLHLNDYIITYPDNTQEVCPHQEFHMKYEPKGE